MVKKNSLVLALILFSSFLFTVAPALAQNEYREWTFMVYMDADNNLDLAGLDDVAEMQSVGSSANVAVVALLDRWGEECGFDGSAVLYVHEGLNETLWGGWSYDYELNMGDPQTLTWFINYTVEAFPADKYALILWDHGGNWEGICWDWTDDDYLTIEEVKEALENSIIGKVDLLGFDACLMASMEVAFTMELSGKVGVMVASEDSIPWDGWPYDIVLSNLVGTPTQNEYELSIAIVDDYIASYEEIGWSKVFTTLSSISLSRTNEVVSSLKALVSKLLADFDVYKRSITHARNQADRYWFGAWHQGPYIDLFNFVHQLEAEETLMPYTAPILDAWSSLVIHSKACSGPHNRGANGLTIYFPRNRNSFYTPEPYYESVPELIEETNWNALLAASFES